MPDAGTNTPAPATGEKMWEKECPLCGDPMVRRRRSSDGSEFYGCSSFPACRGTSPIESSSNARFGRAGKSIGIFESLIDKLDTDLLKDIAAAINAVLREREFKLRTQPPPVPPRYPVGTEPGYPTLTGKKTVAKDPNRVETTGKVGDNVEDIDLHVAEDAYLDDIPF